MMQVWHAALSLGAASEQRYIFHSDTHLFDNDWPMDHAVTE